MARLDSKLGGSILVQDELDGGRAIGGSEFYVAKLKSSQARVIIEPRTYFAAPEELEITKNTIRRLRGMPPERWPVLNCCGALEVQSNPVETSLDILYTFPATCSGSDMPTTLGGALYSSDLLAPANVPHYSQPLVTRLRLAKEIANAVLFVHIGGLVHKNIHPRTILLFPCNTDTAQSEGQSLGNAFLVGFTRSRGNTDDSSLQMINTEGYYDYPTRLYQHPNRSGDRFYTRYNMLHDIYALGVVLLEIGTWKPLVGPESLDDAPSNDALAAHLWASAGQVPSSPVEIKTALIAHAHATIPFCMGNLYLDIVLHCLTCLDGEPSSSVTAKYIEEVLDMLDRIQV